MLLPNISTAAKTVRYRQETESRQQDAFYEPSVPADSRFYRLLTCLLPSGLGSFTLLKSSVKLNQLFTSAVWRTISF